jgi:hypothetical protein
MTSTQSLSITHPQTLNTNIKTINIIKMSLRPLSHLNRTLRRQKHTSTYTSTHHLTPKLSPSVSSPSKTLSSLLPLLQSPDPKVTPSSSPSTPSTSSKEEEGEGERRGKWTLTPSRTGLERTYTFASPGEAWGFVCDVVDEGKGKGKGWPEWGFVCLSSISISIFYYTIYIGLMDGSGLFV